MPIVTDASWANYVRHRSSHPRRESGVVSQRSADGLCGKMAKVACSLLIKRSCGRWGGGFGDPTIVKVSPSFACGKVYAIGVLTHYLKTTSVYSRGPDKAADTEFDP